MVAQNKVYKGKTCADKRCFSCDSDPPTISPSLIKNIGTTFCNMDPEKLKDPPMIKKKKVAAPRGKKQAIRKKTRLIMINHPKIRQGSKGIIPEVGESLLLIKKDTQIVSLLFQKPTSIISFQVFWCGLISLHNAYVILSTYVMVNNEYHT